MRHLMTLMLCLTTASAAAAPNPAPPRGSVGGRHVPTIEAKNGGLFVDGQPFLPSGFANHAHLKGRSTEGSRSYETEVGEGCV